MNAEVSFYYNTLVDKDNDKVKYYYDITAQNKQTGINCTICTVKQDQRKATGAERFKEIVERCERQKYDTLIVMEYGADGTSLVNNIKLRLGKANKGNKNRGNNIVPYNNASTLSGFEQELGRFGFSDGLMGVIDATAEKRTNDYILQQQRQEIADLKTKLALSEQEQQNLKRETESYRERYKEILDEKKDLEREHRQEVQSLQQKNTIGSLAVQGAIGLLAKNTPLGGILSGLLGNPETPQAMPQQSQSDDDDDDDIEVRTTDPEKQRYMNMVINYSNSLSTEQLKLYATITQYVAQGNNLVTLTEYCKQQFSLQKAKE